MDVLKEILLILFLDAICNKILDEISVSSNGVNFLLPCILWKSKFTFDLKFMITIGAVIVSACATYFSITGQIEELKSNNSPNRLEYNYVVKEIEGIKSMGDLKIISYKLDEYLHISSVRAIPALVYLINMWVRLLDFQKNPPNAFIFHTIHLSFSWKETKNIKNFEF